MPDAEAPQDPMVAQFMSMLQAMPDDALVQIYELIEAELDGRGVFADADADGADETD